jgi:hypothetical protein
MVVTLHADIRAKRGPGLESLIQPQNACFTSAQVRVVGVSACGQFQGIRWQWRQGPGQRLRSNMTTSTMTTMITIVPRPIYMGNSSVLGPPAGRNCSVWLSRKEDQTSWGNLLGGSRTRGNAGPRSASPRFRWRSVDPWRTSPRLRATLRRKLHRHCSQARRGPAQGRPPVPHRPGSTSAQSYAVHHLGLSERARRCRGPEQLKPQYPVPAGTLADDCPIKNSTLNSAQLQVVIGLTKSQPLPSPFPFQNEFRTSDPRSRAARMAA